MRRIYESVTLTAQQKQLLLGTLLGDGSMSWAATYGSYHLLHGAIQADYCRVKAKIMGSLISVQPKIVPNYGYGKELCRSSTRSHPCFDFLRSICYRLNPETGRLAKHVTPEWLALLSWEGIAYWYLDDGSISKNDSGNANVVFSTHGFPKEEVELLAQMLTDRGVEAKAIEVHRGPKAYWVVLLGVEATRTLRDKIQSFVPSCMSYKLEIPDPVVLTCAYCGAHYTTLHPNLVEKPACPKKDCQELRRRDIGNKYATSHREEKNQKSREAYHADLEESRKYNREMMRQLMSDPMYRAKVNERKRARRQKAALLRPAVMKPCQFCLTPTVLKNGQFIQGAMICCTAVKCQRRKKAEINRRYGERHAAELAERHRAWNQSERGKSYKHQWFKENYNTPTSSPSNMQA